MKELSDLTGPELEVIYGKKIKEAEEAGQKWAEAKANFEQFEDKKDVILASIKSRYVPRDGEKVTIDARENFALAHPEYTDFLSVLSEARKSSLMATVQYDMGRLKIDCIRSILSNRREEAKAFK